MGRNVAVRGAALAVLGYSLFAGGCQQHGEPLRMDVASEDSGADTGKPAGPLPLTDKLDSVYVNSHWKEPREESQDNVVVSTLVTGGTKVGDFFGTVFVDLPVRTYNYFSGDRPSNALKLMEDPSSADNRRTGMVKLMDLGFATHPPFQKKCRELARMDADPSVRATAIRTGNRIGDPKATPIFVKGLGDSSEWIRLEAAKALANVPDPSAVPSLMALLKNPEENRDVRVASADALKHYRTLTVIRTLCSMLADKSFVVAWQARLSLRYLTDRDYGYDEAAWLKYLVGPEKPLG